jgi:hypothetical protein
MDELSTADDFASVSNHLADAALQHSKFDEVVRVSKTDRRV